MKNKHTKDLGYKRSSLSYGGVIPLSLGELYYMIITIRRKTKLEAARAVFELLERGWDVVIPVTEKKTSISQKGGFNYQKSRYTAREGTSSTMYYARLKREDRPI